MLPEHLREFGDTDTTRKWIYESALEGVKSRFPIEDEEYKLEVVNPHYEGRQDYTLKDQKQALIKRRRLQTPIKGTWRLTHKPSGVVLDEREDTVLQVPYLTNRGTFIRDGNEYSAVSQSRLKPGVYSRITNTGNPEAFYNVSSGTGKNFRVEMDEKTGIFYTNIGQAKIPTYPLLKALGIDDKTITKTWGPDIAATNMGKRSTGAITKYYDRLIGKYAKIPASNDSERIEAIKESLAGYKINKDVVARTLGVEEDNITPEMLLRTTQKLLNIGKGEEAPDDRDAPKFSNILSAEDFIKERIDKDAGKLSKSLFNKVKRAKSLRRIPFGALNPYIDGYILGSRLMMPLEETNPIHTWDQMHRVVKTGEGGIGSADAVTDAARDVNLGQLGFIDPVAGPECYSPDMEVFTHRGWIYWTDVKHEDLFACNIEGRLEFHPAKEIIAKHYTGLLFGTSDKYINYLITPTHRCYVKPYKNAGYNVEYAVRIQGRDVSFASSSDVERFSISDTTMDIDDNFVSGTSHTEVEYDGFVYCATVPGSLLYVRRGEGIGHWSGNSMSVGIDTRVSYRTFKGKDQQMYGEFRNPKTGKLEFLRPEDVDGKVLAFPEEDMSNPDNFVAASKGGEIVKVPASEVDYQVPTAAHMFAQGIDSLTMPTGMMPGRGFYASKYWSQFMPLVKGEVPLVDSQMPDSKLSAMEYYGRKVGALTTPVDGIVTKVTGDEVHVKGLDGKTHKQELVTDLPFNRFTGISYFPSVEVGKRVKAGDMLAHSNFTDKDTGSLNMGVNLKVAIIPAAGLSYEDAHIVSETAAKKLANQRLFGHDLEAKHGVDIDRNRFLSLFPKKFTKEQLEKIGDDGLAKPGTILQSGDPIILGVGPKLLSAEELQLGKLHRALRSAHTDKSVKWEHEYPGKVIDAGMAGKTGMVNVKAHVPLEPGDKIVTSHALKGVVGKILKDEEMPRDSATNEPYEMLLNPMGILSRISPNQLAAIALGKVAKKTGKQFRLPQTPPPEGWAQFTLNQLKEHGLTEDNTIFDPASSKTIKGIGDGYVYTSAFHHLAEKKLSERGGAGAGSYTSSNQPAHGGFAGGGAKRFGGLDINAALSHGARDVIKDVITIRGGKNEDFWKALKLGRPLPEPETPFVYNKFLALLKAGGINIREKGDTLSLLPMTDDDITQLSKGPIVSADMVDRKFNPVPGGLFDVGRTGGFSGKHWNHTVLPDYVPNPVMEEPIRRLLGLRQQDLENIISGTQTINGKTGGSALKEALTSLDIDNEMEKHKGLVQRTRGSNRDNSIKILGYLQSLKQQGIHPSKLMINKMPIIPPIFRPMAQMGDVTLQADLNELYRDVIETGRNIKDLTKELGPEGAAEERLNLYNGVKAAFGLGSPITPEGRARNIKGAIRQVIGDRPKTGLMQSQVISKPVDMVGRGVVTPDKNLDMDTIGIPEESAWTIYAPFIMRKLVRRGYPPEKVLELVKNRDNTAKLAMLEEMNSRPVIVDRAPTWHKFNLMAFNPVLSGDKSLRVSPLVNTGFNLDHNGDSCKPLFINYLYNNRFYCSTFEDIVKRFINPDYTEDSAVDTYGIQTTVFGTDGVNSFKVLGLDDKGVPSWCDVTYISIHTSHGPDCYRVRTKSGMSEVFTAHHNFFGFDSDFNLVPVKTEKIKKGELLPYVHDTSLPTGLENTVPELLGRSNVDNFEVGLLLGYYVGDGSVTGRKDTISLAGIDFGTLEYLKPIGDKLFGRFGWYEGNKCSIRWTDKKLAELFINEFKHTAINKELPDWVFALSEEFHKGLFAGYLMAEGHRSPTGIRVECIAQKLMYQFKFLLSLYGIHSSIKEYKKTTKNNQTYTLSINLSSFYNLNIQWPAVKKAEQFNNSHFTDNYDTDRVPLPKRLKTYIDQRAGELQGWRGHNIIRNSEKPDHTQMRRSLSRGYCSRQFAHRLISWYGLDSFTDTFMTNWLRIVNMLSVRWDIVTEVAKTDRPDVTYDFSVTGKEAFAIDGNYLTHNTMNFHVPVSDKAVKDAYEKMLPSKNLTSLTDLRSVRYAPSKEFALGLYMLTKDPSRKAPKVFNSKAEAKAAYRRGEIAANDLVEILGA